VPPTFLNSREDALLVWTSLILAYAIFKSPGPILGSFFAVLRAFVHPKLLLLYGSTLAYCALVVYAAHDFGLWHWVALKETLYWVVGTILVLVAHVVTHTEQGNVVLLRAVFKKVVTVTVIIEFATNLYAFPFAVELVLTFVIIVFVGMQAVAPYTPSVDETTRRVIDGVLIVVGFIYMAEFIDRAVGDDKFLSRATAEDFLAGPVLTLILIPFLALVAWLSRREQERLQARWRTGTNVV
jgi:hypothetical protein